MSETNVPIDEPGTISRLPLLGWCRRHQEKLWWLHSLYALILGVGVMWLGKRNFAYVRVAVFHISFIWLSSLLLPKLLNHLRLSPRWASRLRLLVNFFNKNFYQQMLFFVLPILWSVSNTQTTRISGVLAFAGFLTLGYPAAEAASRRLARVLGIGFLILVQVELGRPFIPPAPLRLAGAEV